MKYLKNRKIFENIKITYDPDQIVNGYLESVIWTDGDDLIAQNEDDGEYGIIDYELTFNVDDFDDDAIFQVRLDVVKLISLVNPRLKEEGLILGVDIKEDVFGHDFWLTRNNHGSGFWDRTELYGKDLGNWINDVVHKNFKEQHIYVKDQKIHIDQPSMNYD